MVAPTAAVERGPSEGARSGSTGATWVFCHSDPFHSFFSFFSALKEVGRWSSTARIEGPQFYRGASASKEDRLATPRSLIRSGSGRYQRVFDAPDLDLSSMFFRLRQVVGGLHSKPCLGAATECFF